MAASPTESSWSVLEFALRNSSVAVQLAFRRQFGRRGILRRRSVGGMNSFVKEDASVIKESVARGGQVSPKR